jgi:hypothetical protein
MNLLSLCLSLLVLSVAFTSAQAQTYNANSSYGNGIVNAGGQWAQQVGAVGAQANRNAANQLLQLSLQHEAQGFASFPPNFGLLSQALTEARQGIKADDQAKHLAQTSLEAMQVGNTAGNVDLSKYGTTQAQLQDLANNSSPYLSQVTSDMGKYGISVDHSTFVIKTPFGTVPADPTPDQMAAAIANGAKYFGANVSDLANAVRGALSESDAIAKKAMADAQAGSGAKARDVAGAGTGGDVDKSKDPKKEKTAAASATSAAKNAPELAAENDHNKSFDMSERELALARSRAAMRDKLGLKADDIATSDLSLYGLVHQRYQELYVLGRFNYPSRPTSSIAGP